MIADEEVRGAVETLARLQIEAKGVPEAARRLLMAGMTPEHVEGAMVAVWVFRVAVNDRGRQWDGDDLVSAIVCAVRSGRFSKDSLNEASRDYRDFMREVEAL